MSTSSNVDVATPREQQQLTWRSLLHRISSMFGVIGGLGVLLLMLHVVLDVAMRYLFNQPAPATLEVSQFWYMPLIVFLGLAIAERTDQHISAPIVYDHLSPKLKLEFTILGTALSVALLAGMAWYGFEQAMNLMKQGAIGIGSGIPIWQPRFLVPLGSALFALELIARLVRHISEYRSSSREGETAFAVMHTERKLQSASYFRLWPVRITLYGIALVVISFMVFAEVSAPALGGLAALLMLCLLFMNVPIGVAMGAAGALALLLLRGAGVMEGALRTIPFGTAAVWSYTVLPMFIFMALLLWRSGITERIYAAATSWLSWMPGNVAVGTNFAGAGMSAITGSTVATVAALGRIGLPEMLKRNYDPRLAAGSVIIAGTGGQLIPPSIYMVIYAGIASVPVGPQLMAGLVPGLLLAVLYACVISGLVIAMPHLVGKCRGEGFGDSGITWRDRWQSLARVWPLPFLIIIMFGGMFGGFFTATEAGAFGAFGALMLTYIYLKPRKATYAVGQSLKDTVGSTAGIFFLFFGAMIFNRALVVSGVTGVVTDMIGAMGLSALGFLLMLILMYLVLGMILDPLTMMLVTVPLLMPSVEMYGISMVFFGVFVVFLGELAVMTPPVGMMVFILFKLAQQNDVNLGRTITLGQVFIGAAWFLPISIGLLIFMLFVPEITTWLPGLMSK